MTTTASTPTDTRFFGVESGHILRCWVAGFFRLGIGLSLLNAGLRGYFAQQNALNGAPFGNPVFRFGFEPIFTALPYVSIAVGLALIMGFLLTASSIAAAFLSLLPTVMMIFQTLANAGTQFGGRPGQFFGDPFESMTMIGFHITMIPYAMTIWLSPLSNHPISLDALIFGRRIEPAAFPPVRTVASDVEPASTTEPKLPHSSE